MCVSDAPCGDARARNVRNEKALKVARDCTLCDEGYCHPDRGEEGHASQVTHTHAYYAHTHARPLRRYSFTKTHKLCMCPVHRRPAREKTETLSGVHFSQYLASFYSPLRTSLVRFQRDIVYMYSLPRHPTPAMGYTSPKVP